ncbi:MAG: hypothetical protein IIA87_01880 [Nanoarchaeota archaeon]|nr:hypothetical protein [Nanoarchaeota archaeon]
MGEVKIVIHVKDKNASSETTTNKATFQELSVALTHLEFRKKKIIEQLDEAGGISWSASDKNKPKKEN